MIKPFGSGLIITHVYHARKRETLVRSLSEFLLDGLDGNDLSGDKYHISGHVFVPATGSSVEESFALRFFAGIGLLVRFDGVDEVLVCGGVHVDLLYK